MRYSEEYNEWLDWVESRRSQESEMFHYKLQFAGREQVVGFDNLKAIDPFVKRLVDAGLQLTVTPLEGVTDEDNDNILLDDQGEVIFEDTFAVCRDAHKSWPLEAQIAADYANGMWRNVYCAQGETVQICVKENEFKPLPLEPSLKLRNHSPDGFSWGYTGSGPAQLALAILLYEFGSPVLALTHYQDFKNQVIAGLDKDKDWIIPGVYVREWVAAAEEVVRIHG